MMGNKPAPAAEEAAPVGLLGAQRRYGLAGGVQLKFLKSRTRLESVCSIGRR